MAYSRKRKSTSKRRTYSKAPARRKTRAPRRSYSSSSKPRRRKSAGSSRRSSARPQTFKIVVEQSAPQAINPLHQALLAQGKGHQPAPTRKAMF